MNIILAPDSFKGSLSSVAVAEAMEEGVRKVVADAHCVKISMADGGEGTVQAMLHATGGKRVYRQVSGPTGRRVRAGYGLLADAATAVIEMAAASGLALVDEGGGNPLETTTRGTGELMCDALDRGAQKIILGIGGSATNDAGVGMAQALGYRFFDAQGQLITEHGSGGMLDRIEAIDPDGAHPRLRATEIVVACDVDSPLYGERGAAHVFGPQKGASPAMVERLDKNLMHIAAVIRRELGADVGDVPGAGAAGGLGAGLLVFAGARIRSGVELIMQATGMEQRLRDADLLITGEGRIDCQTALGKTVAGLAETSDLIPRAGWEPSGVGKFLRGRWHLHFPDPFQNLPGLTPPQLRRDLK